MHNNGLEKGNSRCNENTHVTLALPKTSSFVEGSLRTSEGDEVPYHLRPFDPENPAYEGTVISDDGSKFPFEIPLKSVPFPASPRENLWTPVSDQQMPYVVTLPDKQDYVVVTNPMQLDDSQPTCQFALIGAPPAQSSQTNMNFVNQDGHHVVYMPWPSSGLVSPPQVLGSPPQVLGTPTPVFSTVSGVQFYSEQAVESFVTPPFLHGAHSSSRMVYVDPPSGAITQAPVPYVGDEAYLHPDPDLVRQANILCTDIDGLSTMYGVTTGCVFDNELLDPADPQTPYLTQGVASLDWHPFPVPQLENGLTSNASNSGIPVFDIPALEDSPWTLEEDPNNSRNARAYRKRKLAEMRARQDSTPKKKRAKKKRAHVLHPGVLSLIPFGMDEQTTWNHRINSFIGRMRRVLGDRRMSVPWGGSILDSVIGVFLTQNVSDTSSSRAFMNVASSFPSKNLPRYGTTWNRADILQDEPVVFSPEMEPHALWNARDCSDMVDWLRIHKSRVEELEECIRCRGMHFRLAKRIRTFLSRILSENLEEWWKKKKQQEAEELEKSMKEKQLVPVEKIPSGSSAKGETLHSIVDRLEDILAELHGYPEEHLHKAEKSHCASNDAPQQLQLLLKSSSGSNSQIQVAGLASTTVPNEVVMSNGVHPSIGCSSGLTPGSAIVEEGSEPLSRSKECTEFSIDDRVFRATQEKSVCQISSSTQPGFEESNSHDCKYSCEDGKDSQHLLGDSEISDHSFMLKNQECVGSVPIGLRIDDTQNVQMLALPSETPQAMEVQSVSSLDGDNGESTRDHISLHEDKYLAFQGNIPQTHCISDKKYCANAAVNSPRRCSNGQRTIDAAIGVIHPPTSTPVAEGSGDKSTNQFDDNSREGFSKQNSEEAATEGTRNSPILLDVDDNYPPVPEFEKRIEIPKTMMQEYDKKNAQKGIRHNPSLPFDKLSLDWLHSLPDDEVVEYLTSSVDGLGRKSASCVMLLCMGRKDFPVDVNVSRICARLGWVPLKTLDKIEELDEYAPEEEVHKYLHKRIMHFDFSTLYELHYQMITLGKVFCTKLNPRCGTCPLRASCEYARNGGESFKQTPAKATSSKRKKAFNTPSQKRSSHQSSNVPHPSSSIFSTPEQNANNNMVPEVCMDSVASAKTSFPREQDVETPRRPRIPVPFPDIEDLASPCKPEPSCGPMHVKKEEAPSMSQQIDQELHEEVHVTAQKIGSPDENEARREYVDAVDIREDLGLGRSSEAIPRIDQDHSAEDQDSGPSQMSPGEKEIGRILKIVDNFSMGLVQTCTLSNNQAYSILGVMEKDASDVKIVRRQYHRLSMLVHPDKCAHSDAGAAFAALNEAVKIATGTCDSPDELFADLGMDYYAEDVQRAAEDCDITNELIVHPGPPTQSRSRRVYFAVIGSAKLLNPIIQAGLPRRIEEDPNPYLLMPDPRVFPIDSSADDDQLMTNRWDILPYLQEGRRDIPFLILMPSRTALRGKFPLNGTFFQVNEVFLCDMPVVYIPISLLTECRPKWRPVYFGSSISHLSLGMRTSEVAQMFHFGYICVRGFDPETSNPLQLPKFLMP